MLTLQKAGHGELVETLAGEWYLAHLASRPLKTGAGKNPMSPDKTASAEIHAGHRCVLGRETCLQRVEWREGWLRLRGRDSLFSLFTQSLIARRVQHFQFTAETCLEF